MATTAPSPQKQTLARLTRNAPGGLITVPSAANALRLAPRDAAIRLGALTRAGWLTRIRRGLYYAIPLDAESSASAIPDDPWVLADALFAPCYVGGWSAAMHWELTEQIFQSTFVASAASVRRAHQSFAALDFYVASIRNKRLHGTVRVWRGRWRVAVSNQERTIVDALITPAWVGGVRHLADILAQYVRTTRHGYKHLLATLDESGTGAARKRFAFLAESLYPTSPTALAAAAHALSRRTTGVVKLDPSVRARGTIHRRWGLAINVAITPAE